MNSCPKTLTILNNSDKTKSHKWYLAIILGILFLVLSSPIVYSFTNRLFNNMGLPTVNDNGVPTLFGIILHTLVFILIACIFL
jgi:hypothetical protein